MCERINIDLDSMEGDGHGLYAGDLNSGIHLFEERPGESAHADGSYLTPSQSKRSDIYVTSTTDDGLVEIINAETMEFIDSISDGELNGNTVPANVLGDYGLMPLELIN